MGDFKTCLTQKYIDFTSIQQGNVIGRGQKSNAVYNVLYNSMSYAMKKVNTGKIVSDGTKNLYILPTSNFVKYLIQNITRYEHFLKFLIFDNPNIISVLHWSYEIDTDNKLYFYYIMEKGDITLESEIHKLSKQHIIQISINIIHALQYLEGIGYIHGDLKPDNIMLFTSGNNYIAKLIDFDRATVSAPPVVPSQRAHPTTTPSPPVSFPTVTQRAPRRHGNPDAVVFRHRDHARARKDTRRRRRRGSPRPPLVRARGH